MDSFTDYAAYTAFRLLGPIFRVLPVPVSFFIGRRIGDIFHFCDARHRAFAYANMRRALLGEKTPAEIGVLTKKFYRNFGQNFIEMFLLPKLDKQYLDRYVTVEGADNVVHARARGKGVILLAVHEGSWELTNVICSQWGVPFNFFVRQQKFPRLNGLLNQFRAQKGCKLITRHNQVRALVEVLKNNEIVGMTADQGGKLGERVHFFGHEASMSSGAVKMALKYDSIILPSFYMRLNGERVKVIVGEPFAMQKTGDAEYDLNANLQALMHYFENCIRQYPAEYLWTYKIWKYSSSRRVLIISDGKAGHLRQSEAIARELVRQGLPQSRKVVLETLQVGFKNNFSRLGLALMSLLTGKYSSLLAAHSLKYFLDKRSYEALMKLSPDIVISCGSSVASVNYLFSRLNVCRSITLLRPGALSLKRFDAVIMPAHDHPPKRKNIFRTEGALNLIDDAYLTEQSDQLLAAEKGALSRKQKYIGLLLGGNTKHFTLHPEAVRNAVSQIKDAANRFDYDVLITTSRRTSPEVESLLERECNDFPRCKLVVNARLNNPSYALGGIVGLSTIVVVSPESISMVSEAASSGRHVVVFGSRVDSRHNAFLNTLERGGYIQRAPAASIAGVISSIHNKKPLVKRLNDIQHLKDCMQRMLS